jgi:hypothetical protein
VTIGGKFEEQFKGRDESNLNAAQARTSTAIH